MECSTWETEVEHCIQKLLFSQNKTQNILMRRGPGLAAGRENCSSHSSPIMTHMFSSITAVLPPNPKGQETIQEAGSWTCWDGDAPVPTGVCPLRAASFKSVLKGVLSLCPDCPQAHTAVGAKNPRVIHLNSSWEKHQATITSQSHILSYVSKHRTQSWQSCYKKNPTPSRKKALSLKAATIA